MKSKTYCKINKKLLQFYDLEKFYVVILWKLTLPETKKKFKTVSITTLSTFYLKMKIIFF